LAVRIGAVPWMPRLLPLITAVDVILHRLTRGHWGVLDLAALPNLVLVVPGRRTGEPRVTPLLCVPYGDGWLVAGSNFGQQTTPMWVHNLAAAGRATVHWKARTHQVDAIELLAADREHAWQILVRTWPNFTIYAARTSRPIRIFELRRSG